MYNPYINGQYPYNYTDINKIDRLNYLQSTNPQLANNYPNYNQSINNMNQINGIQPIVAFECKPVTSIDEAKASTVRLDGNPSYMVDVNAKSIYEKKLDMSTGAANFKIYKLLEDSDNASQTNQAQALNYDNIVSKEDFAELDRKFSVLSQKQDDILLNLKNLIMNGDDTDANKSNADVNGIRKSKSNASSFIKK